MRRHIFLLLLGLVLLATGCSEDKGTAPALPGDGPTFESDVEAMAWALVELAGWQMEASEQELGEAGVAQCHGGHFPLFDFDRTVIADDIAHYSVKVRTGPGEYDRIGIHRVVRERRPYHPIRTDQALFMLHGDLKRFETVFLPGQVSPHLQSDFGIAAWLAGNDVDVWGIDQGWSLVPREEDDFSFFADWGMQKEVDHLAIGLGIARVARLLTGYGHEKMLLLGYSSGSCTGYALRNQESQWPRWQRQVKGFIAADMGAKSDDALWLENCQAWIDYAQAGIDVGQYQDILIFRDAAHLARTDPDGDSPIFPGLTNVQVALYFGGGQIWPPTTGHFHAPILDEGFPVDLQFVALDQWLDFMENTAAYAPMRFYSDYSEMTTLPNSPFADHLGDITVPVFDLGAGGGIAPYTAVTRSYLGSTDMEWLYVSTGGLPEEVYGHIDIFTAGIAPERVWPHVLEWIAEHSD